MEHNYRPLVDWGVKHLGAKGGEICHIEIRHDDWCGVHKGLLCDCNCIGYFPHQSGLHEVAIKGGEVVVLSVDGVPQGEEN